MGVTARRGDEVEVPSGPKGGAEGGPEGPRSVGHRRGDKWFGYEVDHEGHRPWGDVGGLGRGGHEGNRSLETWRGHEPYGSEWGHQGRAVEGRRALGQDGRAHKELKVPMEWATASAAASGATSGANTAAVKRAPSDNMAGGGRGKRQAQTGGTQRTPTDWRGLILNAGVRRYSH